MKDFKKELNKKMKTELPEKLRKENIIKNLQDENTEIKPYKKKKKAAVFLPLAASFIVICTVCVVLLSVPILNIQEEIPTEAEVQTYEEILNTLKKLKKEGYTKENEIENSTDSNTGFGSVNIQEKGVDESGRLLTDGEYIYAVNTGINSFNIIKTDNGKTELLSAVSLKDSEEDILSDPSIYLYENRAAVIYSSYHIDEDRTRTNIKIFDLTDKKSPVLVGSLGQSGAENGSRRIGSKIYLISHDGINIYNRKIDKNLLPGIYNKGIKECISPSDIIMKEGIKTPDYTVIGVYDILSAENTDIKAVFDDCSFIYSTEKNIYTVSLPDIFSKDSETEIRRYEIRGEGVEFAASGRVQGMPTDQFSLSEKDGLLRIAVRIPENTERTSEAFDMLPVISFSGSSVYILDKNLQLLGSLEGIAEGEEIKSARFSDNVLYLVTFRQTDPLFVIDLSDSKNPVIKGEIKLPGYSFYLHPAGEALLAGIGRDGTQEGENDNIRVSLFDVSDMLCPKEISRLTVLDERGNNGLAVSSLAYDHKVFVSLPDNEFAFPVEILSSGRTEIYYLRYRIENNKLYKVCSYDNSEFARTDGGTFINSVFYATGPDTAGTGQILTSYDMETNQRLDIIKF